MKIKLYLILFCFLHPLSSEADVFSVDKILSQESIKEIQETKNFFARNDYQEGKKPWDPFEQKFSEVFLKSRKQIISFPEAIDAAMHASLVMSFGMEHLIQADMSQHEALGNLLPSLRFTLGDGLPIGINNAVKGLFGFLLPQNWLKLKSKNLQYEIAKLGVLQGALDSYMNIRLVFLDLHRIALNVEIQSFYLSHLQLLSQAEGEDGDGRLLDSLGVALGIDLARAVNDIGIHHNNLAHAMAIVQDANKQYSASSLRVDLIGEFPDDLADIKTFGDFYQSKEEFVKKALDYSAEIKMIQELVRIAGYQTGIVAFGDLLSDGSEGTKMNFGVHLSYGNLPRILWSKSKLRESRLDVAQALISFLDTVRRAYGNYVNAHRIFNEASRSSETNRRLFYEQVEKIVAHPEPSADEKFITYLQNLIRAEISRNDALHDGLRRKVILERYMMHDLEKIQIWLPTDVDINSAIEKIRNGKYARKVSSLCEYLSSLKRKDELQNFLDGKILRRTWVDFGGQNVHDLVEKHLDLLLKGKGRGRSFFQILSSYIEREHIAITDEQKATLNYLASHGRIRRWYDRWSDKWSDNKSKKKRKSEIKK